MPFLRWKLAEPVGRVCGVVASRNGVETPARLAGARVESANGPLGRFDARVIRNRRTDDDDVAGNGRWGCDLELAWPEELHLGIDSKLSIDAESREVSVRGRRVDLTHKEFDLLWYLAQRAGRVFSRAQLLDAVWGYSHEGYEHAVNCHINRLRAKIEEDPAHPKLVLTVWGVGYKFGGESPSAG